MGLLLGRHYEEVSNAADEAALLKALVSFAGELDFGRVSAVVLRGDYGTPGFWGKSVGNPPPAYAAISSDPEVAKLDPVMRRLKHSVMPFAYDQRFYVAAGRGEFHETLSQFGYRTGIALGMPTGAGQFLLGVDRDAELPASDAERVRLMADLQLLAVHAQLAFNTLFKAPEAANDTLPPLTPRERQVLSLTAAGYSRKEAAGIMGLSERGVKFHVENAMRKLDVRSKEAAVLKCVQGGLLKG